MKFNLCLSRRVDQVYSQIDKTPKSDRKKLLALRRRLRLLQKRIPR